MRPIKSVHKTFAQQHDWGRDAYIWVDKNQTVWISGIVAKDGKTKIKFNDFNELLAWAGY